MSANSVVKCPKCKMLAASKAAELQAKADAAYGTVPQEEWAQLHSDAIAANPLKMELSFLEYYEIGVNRHGEFEVDYSGRCEKCGFEFSFKHKEQMKVE